MAVPTPIQNGQVETDSPSHLRIAFNFSSRGHTGGYTADTPCQNYCMDLLAEARLGHPPGWKYWFSYIWFWKAAPIAAFNRCVTNCENDEWARQTGATGAM